MRRSFDEQQQLPVIESQSRFVRALPNSIDGNEPILDQGIMPRWRQRMGCRTA
jgi:hypothetical protein